MTEKTINRAYEAVVDALFAKLMGSDFVELRPNPSHPDSIVYTGIGRKHSYVFKMMDPDGRDRDCIAAEAWALTQARAAGVPAPEVVTVDSSHSTLPSTYMVMAQVGGTDLRTPQLDNAAMRPYLLKIGRMLRQLHSVKVDGYGRLESDAAGKVRGFADSWCDAALVALDDGLRVLRDNDLITSSHATQAEHIVHTQQHLLDTNYNSLLHGDLGMIHVFADLKTQKLTGLIDFGECKSGDPVWDFVDVRSRYKKTIIEGYEPSAEMQVTLHDRHALLGMLRDMIWAVRWHDVWPDSVGSVMRDRIESAAQQFGDAV